MTREAQLRLLVRKKQREKNSVSHVGAGSWDEDGTVEAAEVPFYLRARVLVPVAVSLGIIVISVVVAFGYYRRILASQGKTYPKCALGCRGCRHTNSVGILLVGIQQKWTYTFSVLRPNESVNAAFMKYQRFLIQK